MTSEPVEIRMTLPARPGLEVVAAEAAAALALQFGADEGTAGDIRLAVIEGCINSIEHAYRDSAVDARRTIELGFLAVPADPAASTPARLTIHLKDTGRGFDLGHYEEPNLEKKLHSPRKRGWGLRLIRGFMDDFSVQSSGSGTTIVMTKSLGAARG